MSEKKITEVDIIGGFPTVSPNCAGCGKPLLLENAWITDGCPCNTALGVNSMNETRWRLLLQRTNDQSLTAEADRDLISQLKKRVEELEKEAQQRPPSLRKLWEPHGGLPDKMSDDFATLIDNPVEPEE